MTRVPTSLAWAVAAVAAGSVLILSETPRGPLPGPSEAEARIGRPATPLSYAGVARRTTRRAVAAGAAVAAPYYPPPAYRPGCVQVVDPYGRIVYRCP